MRRRSSSIVIVCFKCLSFCAQDLKVHAEQYACNVLSPFFFILFGVVYMFADHLASSSTVNVPAPDPDLKVGEDGPSVPKEKTTNEPEEPSLDVASQTVSAQSSSGNGKSMGESNTGTKKDFIVNSSKRSSLIDGKDNNWNNATENKGICPFAYHP